MIGRLLAALAACALLATGAAAQQPTPPRPVEQRPAADTAGARPDTLRPPGDTLRVPRDSAARDTVRDPIDWIAPDSVMREMLERPGYTRSRYQGDTLLFDARSKGLEVRAGEGEMRKVAVQRDSQLVVSDSLIRYDSAGIVNVRSTTGGRIILRSPPQSDVVSTGGTARYDLRQGLGQVTNAAFTAEEAGETWTIKGEQSAVLVPDSAARARNLGPQLFMRQGTLTSCSEADHPKGPHYHFEFRDLKRTGNNGIFARPAILYVYDVPVMWLPFVFQDLRRGRRSGILTPQFGLVDIIRTSSRYRRQIEDVGYYWTLNDYMDARIGLDWRSGTGGDDENLDPGFTRYKAEWRYRWLNRFLSGELATDYTKQRSGSDNLAISWRHQQEFSRNSSLTTNLNYVTSTQIQRQNTINPYAALATITSMANYQHKLGPWSLSLGGTQKQYPGRDQVERTLPTLNLTTRPIKVGEWLTWTPVFSYNESRVIDSDQAGTTTLLFRPRVDGLIDTTRIFGNTRNTRASFDTPIQIFGWDLRNAFTYQDIQNDFARTYPVFRSVLDTARDERTFQRTFRTDLDWTPSFALPSFSQGRWNFTPSVALSNVDPSAFAVRTELSGGRWVTQKKRPTFSLAISPTFFGLIPGFGPFQRFRHALNPALSWTYAPSAEVSDEFLQAVGRTRVGYLGSLRENSLNLGFSTNIEGKVRSLADTNPDGGEKIKILSLQFTSLSYNFERLRRREDEALLPDGRRKSWIRGITTPRWGYTATSDLLPGVEFQSNYSLFAGDPTTSDTARFSPYLEQVSASFSISQENNPFAVFQRIFGRPVVRPATPAQGTVRPQPGDTLAHQFANQPVAGSGRRNINQMIVPPTRGWQASFTFSHAQSRPIPGAIETDPFIACRALSGRQQEYDLCVAQVRLNPSQVEPPPNTTASQIPIRQAPITSLGVNTSLAISRFWSARWQTTYDFQLSEFASHVVSLQRELHDWNAVFAFTQAPNGNFAFNFFIALKAQPELKFDYNKATYRAGEQQFR